jgi:GTP-binding protein Era
MENKLHGTIAFVGTPNAGKSTLTNALLGQKLSAVSPKVQTTRNAIRAIIVEENIQLIIIDTPGIFIPRQDKILERIIVKSAWQALREADQICFIIDAEKGFDQKNKQTLIDLKKENLPILPVINKVDAVKKNSILTIIANLSDLGFEEILLISAKTGEGLAQLKKNLCQRCINAGWIYDESNITDAPMRFVATEITREKLFLKLREELPYSIAVKNDLYEVLDNGQIKIHQTIFCLKESQKNIIVGKKGEMIKEIGLEARKEISEIVGVKVHLFLFVKVKEDWMNDSESYENLDLNKIPQQK